MKRRLRIALAQGVIFEETCLALEAVGIDTRGLRGHRRLLVNGGDGIDLVLCRPADVPTYVARAADLGIVGSDVLLEQEEEDVLELADLGFGACRFVVAAPNGALDRSLSQSPLKVATKYPLVAERHFRSRGIAVELIELKGAVELAPQVGLSDCIVDLVSTGRTLRANDLVVIDEIVPCSARLIANRASYARDGTRIAPLVRRFQEWASHAAPVAT